MAGVLIAAIGSGWVFLINAASFAAVLFSLCLLQSAHVQVKPKGLRTTNGVIDGFRYVAKRSDLKTILFMAIALGTTPIVLPLSDGSQTTSERTGPWGPAPPLASLPQLLGFII